MCAPAKISGAAAALAATSFAGSSERATATGANLRQRQSETGQRQRHLAAI